MNPDIKSLLIRACGTISYLTVIFFFFTFILFLHNDVKDALKESWSVSVTFLSVLATLAAAIIAANLFNDWKMLHNKTTEKELIMDLITTYSNLKLTGLKVLVSFENYIESKKQDKECEFDLVLDQISTLDFSLSTFFTKYKIYCTFSKISWDDEVKQNILAIRSTILDIDRQDSKTSKISYRHRLKGDIIDFHKYFDDIKINYLISKLEARK